MKKSSREVEETVNRLTYEYIELRSKKKAAESVLNIVYTLDVLYFVLGIGLIAMIRARIRFLQCDF